DKATKPLTDTSTPLGEQSVGWNAADAYDSAPYAAFEFQETHPARLAAQATLFGLTPPPPDHARILELGCAAGSNSMRIASDLPGSQCLGVDISPRQIEQGQRMLAERSITNLELRAANLLDLDLGDERFDYIIAHGLFTWVPDDVRDGIFRLIRDHLSPQGIAYISYNTLPGWSVKESIAEMMRLAAAGAEGFDQTLLAARASLQLFNRLFEHADGAHAELVRRELGMMERKRPEVLVHDELEQTSDPCYFLQFVAWANEYGLRHFADSSFRLIWPPALAPEVRQTLTESGLSWLHAQQYLDYLEWRSFRRSLLCRAEAPASQTPLPDRLDGLYASTSLRVRGAVAVAPGIPLKFGLSDQPDSESVVDIRDGLIQRFLHGLNASNGAFSALEPAFTTALESQSSQSGGADHRNKLRAWVMECLARGWMRISATPGQSHPIQSNSSA
ncbi:MAG: methyltransferase domain-containing protein, partial [Gammaproteobacteria bacterium]